ncbi:hypothetical protein L615_013100000010, partial [Nocardioides sp. J9]|uniref:hypothetical protein n=1 Tax=Nocardioides sp. J9 TaxID=935844 RepID=UPI0011AD47AE
DARRALGPAPRAAAGRALGRSGSPAEQALHVWLVAGTATFVVAGTAPLTGAPAQAVWAVLLLAAVLAARLAPGLAVDVPDDHLLDLDRLAVTAWSAREPAEGGRGRSVVPAAGVAGVAEVAERAGRTLRAASVAILVVVALSAPLLLWTADLPPDRTGARCLVGFGGACLLLAARNHRHRAARRLLRVAGVLALALLAAVLLGVQPDGAAADLPALLAPAAVAVGVALVVAAVLVGRGWRSTWWARRAEVAEALCGTLAVGSLVVAVGLFRHLWELTS